MRGFSIGNKSDDYDVPMVSLAEGLVEVPAIQTFEKVVKVPAVKQPVYRASRRQTGGSFYARGLGGTQRLTPA